MSFFKSGPSLEAGDSATLTGSGNEGTVSNCNSSNIQANDCKLQVSNCLSSNLKLLASNIQMSNCEYPNIQGENFSIRATDSSYLSMDSLENGEFFCEDCNVLNWHGKEGLGEIQRSHFTDVNGAQNQVKSNLDTCLSITGNCNKVASVQSGHLSINGNDNKVLSSNTHHVTVEGDHNNVKVENTPKNGTRHLLSRVSDEGENELTLQKIPGDPTILTEIHCGGGSLITRIGHNNYSVLINGKRIPPPINTLLSVKLNYKDEVSIVGNTYTSGIFKFQLNKLDHDKAQVVVSKEGMDRYEIEPLEGIDGIVISGERDGKAEKLKIIGQEVEDNSETEFEVLF